ncbi:hypothetical protein H2O73_09905 [Vibrio sp. 404]|uniref:Uncharacterized protein n=1 Tax=Vibrio marinisediminis TaxID=2758441 RepID=A0A7W2ITM9_9VIBR|nr:hypothetical protein [Vibrio marinisediminis]MBA5762655.1 hypothetical protein [Vibrio marinisediminis]
MNDTELEFEHLMLEISAQRWEMVERFLLSYFCFREGHVSKTGKPDWQIARERCPRSNSVTTTKHTELEPLVPLASIVGELKRHERDGELSRQSTQRIIDCLLHFAVISKAEKQCLKSLGLAESMPADWYRSLDKQPNARFIAANIVL